MKGKNLSKVLAFLLAAVMIFSALPLMAFASDEAETYTVSYGAPAIPINEMSIVDLTDLEVEMDANGTVVAGADITWAADAQDGLKFNATTKTICVMAAGRYKLTATANGITKNVWVFAKKADETEFVIVDYDFTTEKFVPSEWNLIAYNDAKSTGTPKNTDGTNPAYFTDKSKTTNGYVIIGPNNGAELNESGGKIWMNKGVLINNDEIFKDFADYTVISRERANTNKTNDSSGPGNVGRAKLSENGAFAADKNSLVGYFTSYGAVTITSNSYGVFARNQLTMEGTLVNREEGATDTEKYLWNNNDFHTVTTVFDGDNLIFSFDGTVAFDLSKASTSVKNLWARDDVYTVDAGYPGVVAWNSGCHLQAFKVVLNSKALAPSSVANFYNVSYGAPAIPMNANTAVNLDFISVEMDDNGTVVCGDEIVWNAAKQDGLYLNKKGNKVSVYAAGNYKLTATANGVTKNVWIVAKNADETVYNMVDYDFREETFNSNEWKLLNYASAGGGAVGTAQPTDGTVDIFSAYKNGTSSGYVQLAKDGQGGILLNTAEIFKDFRDYTVTFEAKQATSTNVEYTGIGSAARVSLAEDGTLDPDKNSILSFILGSAKARIQSHRGSWWAGGVTTNSEGVVSDAANFIWRNSNYHKVVSVYQGDNFVYTFDGAEIFDLSKASASVKTAWEKDINKAMDPGYPGMFTWKAKTYIRTFSVALNTTTAPDAIAVEYAPEADITIVGEGTAAVEAVVGSENNYTVALAPAEGYKVKVGSLVIDGKPVILGVEGDTTGRLYTFKSEDLNATTISVEYIPDDGTFNSMMLGATIPLNPEKKGIRFGARTDFIRRNGETGLLGDKLLVDGVVYEPTEVGMLFIPSALIDGELTVDTERVTRQAVSKVVKLTGDFSDIAITLVGIPESYFGVQISSRMYVAYEVDGETKYVYTEVIERSYNDVVAAIGK